jgi:hypothetical protein
MVTSCIEQYCIDNQFAWMWAGLFGVGSGTEVAENKKDFAPQIELLLLQLGLFVSGES